MLHTSQARSLPTLNADRIESFALTPTTTNSGLVGWVRNLNTQRPVTEATVIISAGLPVTTNVDGYFQALNLPTGFYTATALAPLYAPVTLTAIELRQGVAAVRTFDLPAPHLDYAPRTLEHTLTYGDLAPDGAGLVLSSTGQMPLAFAITEIPAASWLAAAPATGSVAMSATQDVTITWGGAGIDQPGVYTTALHLNTADPEAQDVSVPVTLTVLPASTQGLLTGVVSTTGSCDVNLAPLAGAQAELHGLRWVRAIDDGRSRWRLSLLARSNAQPIHRHCHNARSPGRRRRGLHPRRRNEHPELHAPPAAAVPVMEPFGSGRKPGSRTIGNPDSDHHQLRRAAAQCDALSSRQRASRRWA